MQTKKATYTFSMTKPWVSPSPNSKTQLRIVGLQNYTHSIDYYLYPFVYLGLSPISPIVLVGQVPRSEWLPAYLMPASDKITN
jgi:hypothetical protein